MSHQEHSSSFFSRTISLSSEPFMYDLGSCWGGSSMYELGSCCDESFHVHISGISMITLCWLCREMFDEYGDATTELMLKVLELLSENVGQPSDYIYNKIGGNKAGMRTYFNYYPPCPQPELAMGLSKHSDLGILTALQQGDIPGLELLKDGNWITVPSVPHAFVFFAADALQARKKPQTLSLSACRHIRFSVYNIL